MAGISGVGAIFSRSATGTDPWTALAGITNVGGPGFSRGTIDTTALDTTGGYRTFIASFRESGQVTLAMNFTNATAFSALKADFDSDDLVYYKITLPDTDETTLTFQGLVVGMPLTIPEGVITIAVTIQISGPVTVA